MPYSNKKLASMDMEERYRLIISTVLDAIGLDVATGRMIATGRIDMTVKAAQQILDRQYLEQFKADKRKVIGLAIELDEAGKGLLDWKTVE